MSERELARLIGALGPHIPTVALCAARLLPVVFLCPLLGGQVTPLPVKVAVTLSLAMGLHLAGGVVAPAALDTLGFIALVLRELTFGTVIGLVAALPFDVARIGGRFIDLFRGATAEAVLPVSGTRESATGDGLYQLLVALVASGGTLPLVIEGLWRSFAAIPLGGSTLPEDAVLRIISWAGASLATGLAVGAPIAALSLVIDLFLGLASRAAPQLNLLETGAPLRILGGGAVLWMGIGLISDRLLSGVFASDAVLRELLEVVR